jgi:aminobenzoyl-glutamate utilization protein B
MYEEYLDVIRESEGEICAVSDAIWGYAETAYGEYRSMRLLSGTLERHGFSVERGLAGIPTCFIATYGQGDPVIAIQAEYDALDGLSQQAGVSEPTPVPGAQTGHGCGHNLFAGGSLAAALAVKRFVEARGSGTVRFYGCPAEEGGAGKVFMAREGLYRGVDAVVSWHPATFHMVRTRPSLANICVDYMFSGVAAHAGGSPEKGRSALDAAELMNIGANFLREHMRPEYRIHYAFLDCGGTAPNVVQSRSTVRYLIRATDQKAVRELKRRVDLIAGGAAMMTETQTSQKIHSGYADLITIPALQRVANEALHDTPAPHPTEEDLAFAARLQRTMPDSEELIKKAPYPTEVLDPAPPVAHGGSTDTADVSWNCPTVQLHIGTWMNGTPGHSWQAVAQGKSPFAKQAMLFAGRAVAGTVMRLFDRPEELAQAKREHAEKTGDGYVCSIPEEIKPALQPDPDAREPV